MNSRFAVIDFETTGLSPDYGDRITEVAVAIVESNKAVDQYQSLVKTGVTIPYHIQKLTGITNQMLSSAPPASEVMQRLHQFTKGATFVAHNASFDSKFFHSELLKAGIRTRAEFICTLLLSRRLYPFLENLKLTTLAAHHRIQYQGRSHRALADALVTTDLFIQINADLKCHLSANAITPQKFLASQREPLSNFSKTARLLKTSKKIPIKTVDQPKLSPQKFINPNVVPKKEFSKPQISVTNHSSSPSPNKVKAIWIKTHRGLQNKTSGLVIPYADTLRDVFPVSGYSIKVGNIGFIKDSEIES